MKNAFASLRPRTWHEWFLFALAVLVGAFLDYLLAVVEGFGPVPTAVVIAGAVGLVAANVVAERRFVTETGILS